MGKKSPPQQPDYTSERAAFAQSESANRQNQANAYNAAVNSYNSGLSDLSSQLSSLGNSFQNYSIVDDEKWGADLNNLSNLEKQFNLLQSNLGSASSKPNFSSMVQSAYGPVEVGIPNLVDQNTTLANSFSSQLGTLRSQLAGLQSQRKAEEARIDSFANGLSSQLASLGSNINGYGIADIAGINAAKSQLAEVGAGLSGFSSSILSEYKPNALSTYQTQVASLGDQLNSILAQRSAEEERIRGYEANLNSTYDNLAQQFSGLTIADIAGIEQLQREIDAQQLGAGRFTSQLGFNFNDELTPYSDLEARLGSLRAEREAELNRVKTAESQAQQGIMSILSQLGSTDIYNRGQLNQIDLALDQGLNDINGFSSVLGGNFSGVLSQIEQARAQLTALEEQRANALSGFGTNANALASKIAGYDLANENGLRSGLTEAQQLAAQLSQFTGTDVGQYRSQVEAAIAAANGRLSDLSTERGNIENAARQLLTGARSSQFTSTTALDELAAQLGQITDRQTNYNAVQAQDEVDAITALIGGERTRLKADADAAAAAQQAEQEAYQKYLASLGNPGLGFGSYIPSASPWLSGSAYRYRPGDLPSSFARQLQVVYA